MKENDQKLVIRKDNELIRQAINKFSYTQNRLMGVLLGKYVHTKENYCIDTTITIDELRKELEMTDGKENYEAIRKAVEAFGENGSVGIYDPRRDKYIWRPYFKEIELDKNQVHFVWNDAMKDDLIDLKNRYTQYLACNYLSLKSEYSQNLYEQLKSYESVPQKPQIVFSVDDLHRIMQTKGIKTYSVFNSFKNLCIIPAVKNINKKTDLDVEIEVVKDKKDKRKAFGIAFYIYSKNKKPKNYHGCYLTEFEYNELMKEFYSVSKMVELGQIKKEKPSYYTFLRQGNKSDYEVLQLLIEEQKRADQERKNNKKNDIPDSITLPDWYEFKEEEKGTSEDVKKVLELQKEILGKK